MEKKTTFEMFFLPLTTLTDQNIPHMSGMKIHPLLDYKIPLQV